MAGQITPERGRGGTISVSSSGLESPIPTATGRHTEHNCRRLRAPPRQSGRPQDRKGGKRVSQKKGRKGSGVKGVEGEGGGGGGGWGGGF